MYVRSASGTSALVTSIANVAVRDTTHRLGIAWKVNDFALYAQATLDSVPDTAGAIPTTQNANIYIGAYFDGTAQFFGCIRNLRFYAQRLTTGQMARLGSA